MSLSTCEKCGWQVSDFDRRHGYHKEHCDPKAGALAKRLIKKLEPLGVVGTMHGYGDGHVAFDAAGHTLVFRVSARGFTLDHVHATPIVLDKAAKLVTAFQESLK